MSGADRPDRLARMKPLPTPSPSRTIAPDPTLNRHNTDSQAGKKTDDPAKLAKDKNQDVFTAAMRQLERAREDEEAQAPQAGELPPLKSEPLTSGGKPIKFRRAMPPEGSKPRDVQWPASASRKPTARKAPPTTAPAEPADPPAPPDAEVDKAVAKPAPRPAVPREAAKLRVTAIMRGPDGNVAIINGGLYRKGQTVKGATIVRIGQYEVELVADGKRFTIRI